jgi:hypothetical protein
MRGEASHSVGVRSKEQGVRGNLEVRIKNLELRSKE